MNKRLLITAMLTILVGTAAFAAQKVWHLKADGIGKVPISAIEYIVHQPGSEGLDVVLNRDDVVYKGVKHATFVLAVDAGVEYVPAAQETIVGPYDNEITITGLKDGATIAVYDTMGSCVIKQTVEDGRKACKLDLSGLQHGVYILRTTNSAVKFLKK